ncbi:MAG: dihydroorotase [Candidatus Eisenbacteria bacterium]|uniref:Dihydroorotase n=1 Tax=Eiseniibacteriota bacterium TaxID=2212470 RepID=A0A538U9E6_UNCEI|nr:MAG: dihydroorotase [Candidatus Eisenbacteria bacterium]
MGRHGAAGGADEPGRGRDASRPHESRHRDRVRGGRRAALGDLPAGDGRRRRALRGARALRPGSGPGGTRVSERLVVRNGRHWRTGEPFELAVEDERIVASGGPRAAGEGSRTLDALGAVLAPGLVDLHVHLREPGGEGKETIETGTRAAAAGGFTAVACMPNTQPVVDNRAWVAWIRERARAAGHCRVHPIAAVTMGQRGEQLTEMLALAEAGAAAFSDDGRPVMSAEVMRRALEYARPTGLPIVCHEEDLTLRGQGHMHEGAVSARLGLAGIPAAAEVVMVRRDVELAELTGGRVHLAHLSAAGSYDALRDAKRRGLAVTGETCPHYWTLSDEAVGDYDTCAKMNPPLRSAADRAAVIEAIRSGVVDCFATDHAPHTLEDKRQPFDLAPFGIVGLETALLWTDAPRRVFGLPEVTLAPGSPADFTLIDPELEWTVDASRFHSKGRNTPFEGWTLTGKALGTWCGGIATHREESWIEASAR